MRFIILITIFSTLVVYTSYCQTDSLIIKLKSEQIEKIAIDNIRTIQFEDIIHVDEGMIVETSLELKGNTPNPFSETTQIAFEIAKAGNVEIIIYNSSGNKVNELYCKDCQAGKNIIHWDALNKDEQRVTAGVYYYEVHFNNEIQSQKMIIIK